MKKFFVREEGQPTEDNPYPRAKMVEVPQAVAELEPKNGFYALFLNSDDSHKVTSYINLAADEEFLATVKADSFSHLDCMGTPLNIGDFVLTTLRKYADLQLCRVSAFTNAKVRVVPMKDIYNGEYIKRMDTTLKSPCDIVKTDSALFL